MVIDLNRPPLPLPPKDPDGVIKVLTIDSRNVYLPGQLPDLPLIHRLMMKWYFPYHQRIDEIIDRYPIRVAFDCHSMQPYGSAEQIDAGKPRPLICLGNYGDQNGRAKPGSITTCPGRLDHLSRRCVQERVSRNRRCGDQHAFLRWFYLERPLLAQRCPSDPD